MEIFKTTYDGYIVVKNRGKITAYEGTALCPLKVIEHFKANGCKEIDAFYWEAISYGMI